MPFFFFEPIYLIIIVVGFGLSMIASAMTKSAFHKGREMPLRTRVTGAEVARQILRSENIDDVEVVETQGFLSDHYNPMSKTLALSPDVFHGRHASAAGVAAHEVGHAIQHARGSIMMWMRSALVPAAQFGSSLGPLLAMIGVFMGAAEGVGMGRGIAITGVILFGAATLFTVITVPVEFDASGKAKQRLAVLGITSDPDEEDMVRKVLFAAGLTYVAAAVTAIMQLLYWAWRAGLLGSRN